MDIREHYTAIDAGDIPKALAIFSDDIVYARGSKQVASNLEELKNFYAHDSIIATGTHTVHAVVEKDNGSIEVSGAFQGTLKTGESVQVVFVDIFYLEGEKVVRRQTIFPGREV